jgi:sugar lactone lactonase YvrE
MYRREFLDLMTKGMAAAAIGAGGTDIIEDIKTDLIVGHGTHRYKVDKHWGELNPRRVPVKDCHEMVIDSKGRIVLLTNHTQNNIIIYSKKGRLRKTWGTEYPGAHGLTLMNEGGEDMLYITDTVRHEVIKTTIDGKVIMTLSYPKEVPAYQEASQYQPTETAIAANGDIYIADGYGQQHILHYNAKGELLNAFGGRGEADDQFNNAHGICIDNRSGSSELLITARQQNKLKRFSLDGKWIANIDLPGAYICRPVIKGENVYLATIWTGEGWANTGIISILDKDNRLVSAPGGIPPIYTEGKLFQMYQQIQLFKHPHDVCIDEDDNLYVAQWNANQVYPYKLIRV